MKKKKLLFAPKKVQIRTLSLKKVLQAIYSSLVSKVSGKTLGCITIKDASELSRKSLNECTKSLRAGGDFNASEYEKWAEIYYQVLVLIFEEQVLTPFKRKNTPYATACGEHFYTKSLGTFVRICRKIQPPCEQGFPK